jgi:UDP-N-acetylglucosamine diphosphorylase/glucosamine-1-phosphate N-acetyltransferase
MRVCLFEDAFAADLEPLALTRPAFELRCGLTTLAAKQIHFFHAESVGFLVRPHLAELVRLRSPGARVNDLEWLRSGPVALINGRWLPPPHASIAYSGPCLGLVGDEIAYAVVDPMHLADLSGVSLGEFLEVCKRKLPGSEVAGQMVRHLWNLVQTNGEQIIQDWQSELVRRSTMQAGLPTVVGPRDLLSLEPSARVDPMVVIDTTGGPVVIESEAAVHAFSRIEGPCCIGARTQVQGAKIRAGTTLGPNCRIGGEVEASIVQGHSNKYHDGFLGHAYVGEWVNLGAGTQNSDLRNDYGEVRVMVNGRLVATGQTKVGCFLGDHVKTGLGTLLNTGTNAGIFCNLLPGSLLPRYIPSFASWWNQLLVDRTDLDQLFRTAAEVMRRRGAFFTETHAFLYRTLHEQTAGERRRVLRDAELRELRKSA